MRRTEVQETLVEAIKDHFPHDVAEKFQARDLEQVARELQNQEKDDYGAIDRVVRDLRSEARDSELDSIADGNTPAAKWFYDQIYY